MKDLKNESGLVIQISQHSLSLLESFRFGLTDLHKMNEDQLKQLKDCMLEHPGHLIFKKLLRPQFNHNTVEYERIGRVLINHIVDIAAKKLPVDLPFSNKQLETIVQKIKFFPVPRHVIDDTIYKEETIQDSPNHPPQTVRTLVQEKNTNERAFVRLRVPRKRIEEEYTEVDAHGVEKVKKIERFVEIDMDDKVLIFPAMVSQRDYTVYAFNQYAPRAHRRDIFNSIKKHFADHFEGRDAVKDFEHFSRKTDDLQEKVEKKFIDEQYDEEKMPILDFEININEGE